MEEGEKSKEIFSNLIPGLSDKLEEEVSFPISEELQNSKERYTKPEKIGEGGMKKILSCSDNVTSRKVAKATLHQSDDPELAELFFKEARLTAHLEHPNIMPLYDLGYDESGDPFFTMKLTDGQTLKEFIEVTKDSGKVNFRATVEIFSKICNAISYAHSRNIVHLDLKPDNIYLGQFGEVLVCDWGLAKYIGDDEVNLSDFAEFSNEASQHGLIKGTPGYMAPEQIDNSIGPRETLSDIYALGGILYSLLCSEEPIANGEIKEVCERTLKGQILSPSEVTSGIPQGLEAVAMKALSTKPLERYKSVEELTLDIQKWLDGYLTSAEEQSSFKALQLMIKRHRALSIFLSILLILTICFSVIISIKERAAVTALKKYEKEKNEKEKAGKEAAPRLAHLSLVAFKNLDFKSSHEFLEQALLRDPKSDEAWQLKARYSFFNQDFDKARAAIKNVKLPSSHKAVNNLSKLLPNLPEGRLLTLAEFETLLNTYETNYDIEFLYMASLSKYSFEDQIQMCKLVLKSSNKKRKNVKFDYEKNDEIFKVDLSSNSKLERLKAIRPLPITHLDLSKTKVYDLSDLFNMPLEVLKIHNTPVKKLDVLKDIPTLKKLYVSKELFERGVDLGDGVEVIVVEGANSSAAP